MLNDEQLQHIVDAIRAAEKQTSGEIRVYIAKKCPGDPFERAAVVFKKQKMYKTALRNAVLIFVSPADRKTAILGDTGIDDVATDGFWNDVLDEMVDYFRNEQIAEGICHAVGRVGELIKFRYPVQPDDINELSDEVIFEK